LAAEENANRARASGQAASWAAAVQARIERAWIRPESARAGLDCTVLVNQVPGGEVTGARIKACNGDEAVRQSIEAAVYRASPLPAPPDPALFERTIEVRFRPHD
jgi:colicin import membrane protein